MNKVAIIEAHYTTAPHFKLGFSKHAALVGYLDDWRSMVRFLKWVNYHKRFLN